MWNTNINVFHFEQRACLLWTWSGHINSKSQTINIIIQWFVLIAEAQVYFYLTVLQIIIKITAGWWNCYCKSLTSRNFSRLNLIKLSARVIIMNFSFVSEWVNIEASKICRYKTKNKENPLVTVWKWILWTITGP